MKANDEQVVAAVIAAASSMRGWHVARGPFIRKDYDPSDPTCTIVVGGQCCAIGAGALYAGADPLFFNSCNATDVFSRLYGVSRKFSVGVSDGFENRVGRTDGAYETDELVSSAQYIRGWAVGQAIAVALGIDDEVEP